MSEQQTYSVELTRDELQVLGLVVGTWMNEHIEDTDTPFAVQLMMIAALQMWHPAVFVLHLESIVVKCAVLEDDAIPGDMVMPGLSISEGDRKDARAKMRSRLEQRRAELREAGLL